jgi:hypothetical protein
VESQQKPKQRGPNSYHGFLGHTVFVGLNESACQHDKDIPELRPNYVYFTTPLMTYEED